MAAVTNLGPGASQMAEAPAGGRDLLLTARITVKTPGLRAGTSRCTWP